MKSRIIDYSLLALGVLTLIASYLRLYSGVDFTDEAYYSALPYRFILGDKPFIDEHSVHLLAALVILPFHKIFYLINKSTEGIALYSRHLYFISYLLLGYLSFKTFKNALSVGIAFLLGCISAIYVPLNIMSLSYNSLSVLCFSAASLFAILDQDLDKRSQYTLPLAAFFYSLAIFSYPSMILPTFIALLVIILRRGVKESFPKLLLGFLPIVCVSLILLMIYKFNIINSYYYFHDIGYLSSHKKSITTYLLTWKAGILFPKTTGFLLIGTALLPVLLCLKNNNRVVKIFSVLGFLCAITLPIFIGILYSHKIYVTLYGYLLWYYLFIHITLLAPLYFIFVYRNEFAKNIFWILWVPSFIAGIATSLTSGNGFIGNAIGLTPALVATVALIYLAIKKNAETLVDIRLVNELLPAIVVLFLFGFVVLFKFTYTYRDANVFGVTTQMKTGPFKYLYTTYPKYVLLNQLQADINFIEQHFPAKKITVYPACSGIYLFSKLKPLANTLWLVHDIDNKFAIQFIEHNNKPDVSIIVNQLARNKNNNLLQMLTSDDYLNVIDRRTYSIYLKKKVLE